MVHLHSLTSGDLVGIAARRKWLIISMTLAGIAIAWSVFMLLPRIYRSSTLILVENQKIPESYVAAVGGSVGERLTFMKQQVLSRTVLKQVATDFHLFPEQTTGEGPDEEMYEALRKRIAVDTKGGASGRIEAFSISFTDSNPETAMHVTAKLASQFIEENLKAREQLAEGTTEFLDQELAKAKQSLEEQEHALALFKRKNMGELPGQLQANLETLNRMQKDLAAVNVAIQSRTDQRVAIHKMLNAYETMGVTLLEAQRDPLAIPTEGARDPGSKGTNLAARPGAFTDPLLVRLRELERTLDNLLAEYKETYPDVVQIKKEIKHVKARLAEKLSGGNEDKDEKDLAKGQSEKKVAVRLPEVNPVDPYWHELKREREELEISLSSLKEQQGVLTVQSREYQLRVERAPEREQEMMILQRDYENTKKNYQALFEKQLNARISENLEKRQKLEKFHVLDPANLPTYPESPNLVRVMLTGLLLGGGIGCGTAFGLEAMAGVFRRPEDAEVVLGLPVLAAISDFKVAYRKAALKELPSPSMSWGTDKPKPGGLAPSSALGGKVEPGPAQKTLTKPWKKTWSQDEYASKRNVPSASVMLELNMVAKWRPMSVVAEQYRVAASRLVLSSGNQKNSVIVVTSAMTGEGKSSTACNLAYVLAQDLGKQTLLIDCDFKRPMVHAYTGVPSMPGLAEAIYGDAPLEACTHQCGETSMWVLPAGRRDHRLVDLAKIPQLKSIVTELRARFEFIILDAPPILPLADMNLLASMGDVLVLVVRAGVTHHEIVQKGLKAIKPLSRAVVILTGYDQGNDSEYLQRYHHAGRGTYHK